MHAAIDLGHGFTNLVCWETSSGANEACIRVRIPGIDRMNSPAGNAWTRTQLREYFTHLYREYLLPSRKTIKSMTVAVPGILGLHSRRALLDVLEEIVGLDEVIIVPHSIALAAGWQAQKDNPTNADILIIEASDSTVEFIFLSIIDGYGITMEKHFSGVLPEILEAIGYSGYHNSSGWSIDYVLTTGNYQQNQDLGVFIDALPSHIKVDIIADWDWISAQGLYLKNTVPAFVIYPNDFYLRGKTESSTDDILYKIPFDTANLELSCAGKYRLLNLNNPALSDLIHDSERIRFQIYEIKRNSATPGDSAITLPNPILDIDSHPDDIPSSIDIVLDMAAATLGLDLHTGIAEDNLMPEPFTQLLRAQLEKICQDMVISNDNKNLVQDVSNILSSPDHDPSSLASQVQTTLLHLYALLQIWSQ